MNNTDSQETWKEIDIVNGLYSVSDKGRVRNNRTGYILKPTPFNHGYMKVNLKVEGTSITQQVHRLVAMAFIPNPENKPEVNHKNGIHDDNRVENLEWVTGEENRNHAYETGLQRHKDPRYGGYLYGLWKNCHKETFYSGWQDFLKFYKWCFDNGYSEGEYVARYDPKKKYSPQNCYISKSVQRMPRKYDCFGEKLSLDEMSQKYGIYRNTIEYRIKNGMSAEEAITYRKTKPNDNCLKLRLNDSLYDYLIKKSYDENRRVSEIVRNLISADMETNSK